MMLIIIIFPLWVISIYPFLNILYKFSTISLPIYITEYQILRLIITTTLLVALTLIHGIKSIIESRGQNIEIEKKVKNPLILLMLISVPLSSAYIYQASTGSIGQTILDFYLLFDDFNEHTPPTPPDGWTPYSGSWQTVYDVSTSYEQIDMGHDRAISYIGDFAWTDYEFNVDVKLVTSGTGAGRGALLLFRVQDASNYYFLAILDDLNQVRLYRRIGGNDILIQTININVFSGVWFNLRIRVNGQIISVWGNDVPLFSDVSSGGNLNDGLIALASRFYHCRFDNVTISPI